MRVIYGMALTLFLICLLAGCGSGGGGNSTPSTLSTIVAPTVKAVTQQNATNQIASALRVTH